jgi:hypothetical protein
MFSRAGRISDDFVARSNELILKGEALHAIFSIMFHCIHRTVSVLQKTGSI